MYHLLSSTYKLACFYSSRQTISCYYVVNETQTVSFSYKPQSNNPAAEVGSGQLMVQMRLAQGEVALRKSLVRVKMMGRLFNGLLIRTLLHFRFIIWVLLSRPRLSSNKVSEAASVLWSGIDAVTWPKFGAPIGELLGHSSWGQDIHAQLGPHCWQVGFMKFPRSSLRENLRRKIKLRVFNTFCTHKCSVKWNACLNDSLQAVRIVMTATWPSSILS